MAADHKHDWKYAPSWAGWKCSCGATVSEGAAEDAKDLGDPSEDLQGFLNKVHERTKAHEH
ncbi:MAG: hypothetical protein V3U34_00620 [candidate division NC10 bacterium]